MAALRGWGQRVFIAVSPVLSTGPVPTGHSAILGECLSTGVERRFPPLPMLWRMLRPASFKKYMLTQLPNFLLSALYSHFIFNPYYLAIKKGFFQNLTTPDLTPDLCKGLYMYSQRLSLLLCTKSSEVWKRSLSVAIKKKLCWQEKSQVLKRKMLCRSIRSL